MITILRFGADSVRPRQYRLLSLKKIASMLNISHEQVRIILKEHQMKITDRSQRANKITRAATKKLAEENRRPGQFSKQQLSYLRGPETIESQVGFTLE